MRPTSSVFFADGLLIFECTSPSLLVYTSLPKVFVHPNNSHTNCINRIYFGLNSNKSVTIWLNIWLKIHILHTRFTHFMVFKLNYPI